MQIHCEICSKEFYKRPSHVKRVNHNYCSRKCRGISHRGSGNPVWKSPKKCVWCAGEYKGKGNQFCSQECMGQSYTGKKHDWYAPSGERHYAWKGENVSYKGLHHW